jgi:pimeloyl-ACP methyl ester carboxylesterase
MSEKESEKTGRTKSTPREAPRALDAAHHSFETTLTGRIGYYVDAHTPGRPIALVHGVHAAASAYDMRPLFESFRTEGPVYALDLPGFGTSERSPGPYSAMLYSRVVERFLTEVVSPRGEPVDIVALSLSCEFTARAALHRPELFRTLTLISPTGFTGSNIETKSVQSKKLVKRNSTDKGVGKQTRVVLRTLLSRPLRRFPSRHRVLELMLRVPIWTRPVYRVLTTRPIIKHFLKKSFHGKVPADYVDFAVRTSRVSGAHEAPTAFVVGQLFSKDAMGELYARLRVPTLILYDRDPYTRFDRLPELTRRNPTIRAHRIDNTCGMPHFEQRDEVAKLIRDFGEEARRGEEAEARA